MRANTAKRRMLAEQPAIGAAVGLGSPLSAEILSLAGFDFVLVDNQHGAWEDNGAMLAFRSICLGPATPMVRVQQNDFYTIGRLLDRGALGIVVPMVNSLEDARAAAYAVRYPPKGGRSWGPFGARLHGPDYESQIDDEVFLAVQIESVQAVDHAREILAVDGVDGCWIGPSDLSNSMGLDRSIPREAETFETAVLEVLEACRALQKIPGIAAGSDAQHWIEHGFLFVTVGEDSGFLTDAATRTLRELGRLL
jgi:4-hydroxy-2-oxoheptanedioate aldolase